MHTCWCAYVRERIMCIFKSTEKIIYSHSLTVCVCHSNIFGSDWFILDFLRIISVCFYTFLFLQSIFFLAEIWNPENYTILHDFWSKWKARMKWISCVWNARNAYDATKQTNERKKGKKEMVCVPMFNSKTKTHFSYCFERI